MSKRDELTRTLGGNVAESMGQHGGVGGRPAACEPCPPTSRG